MTNQQICPLCQAQNQCALALGKRAENCWCMSVPVPAQVVSRLPPEIVNTSCICEKCAKSYHPTDTNKATDA